MDDFIEVLKEFPDDREEYAFLKDSIVLEGKH